MRAGDVIARDNGKVHVLAWKDKRVVKAISTKHDASTTTITRRIKRGGGATEEVSKPACIVDYNKYMAGVDGLDQMISYYPFTRKSVKWTTKVLFYLMEISVHNAYVLYKARSSTKKYNTMFKFVLQLAKQLLPQQEADAPEANNEGAYDAYMFQSLLALQLNNFFRTYLFEDVDVSPRPPKQPRIDPPGRLHGGFKRHKMSFFPPTEAKRNPSKACRVCRKKGRRRDTRYFCEYCEVALCACPCFHDYHTEQFYA